MNDKIIVKGAREQNLKNIDVIKMERWEYLEDLAARIAKQ